MVWAGSFPMGVYTSVQASTEAQPSFVAGARSKILLSGLGGRKAANSMGKMSTLGVPSAALGTGSSDSAPSSAVSSAINA
jgi:hypothetical protein